VSTVTGTEDVGGYAAVAAALTEHFRLTKPLDRRRVEMWSARSTHNAAGQPFPQRWGINTSAKPRQPRVLFDIGKVIEWATPGVPFGPRGRSGYTLLGQPGSVVEYQPGQAGTFDTETGRAASLARWNPGEVIRSGSDSD
jgi:hypothetical protein